MSDSEEDVPEHHSLAVDFEQETQVKTVKINPYEIVTCLHVRFYCGVCDVEHGTKGRGATFFFLLEIRKDSASRFTLKLIEP